MLIVGIFLKNKRVQISASYEKKWQAHVPIEIQFCLHHISIVLLFLLTVMKTLVFRINACKIKSKHQIEFQKKNPIYQVLTPILCNL